MPATMDPTAIIVEREEFFNKASEYLTDEQVAFVRKAYDLAEKAIFFNTSAYLYNELYHFESSGSNCDMGVT